MRRLMTRSYIGTASTGSRYNCARVLVINEERISRHNTLSFIVIVRGVAGGASCATVGLGLRGAGTGGAAAGCLPHSFLADMTSLGARTAGGACSGLVLGLVLGLGLGLVALTLTFSGLALGVVFPFVVFADLGLGVLGVLGLAFGVLGLALGIVFSPRGVLGVAALRRGDAPVRLRVTLRWQHPESRQSHSHNVSCQHQAAQSHIAMCVACACARACLWSAYRLTRVHSCNCFNETP